MAAYLLAWNPNRWRWDNLPQVSKEIKSGKPQLVKWSCGNSKRIRRGDRVFLIRLGKEPKGIIASGIVTKAPYKDLHWDGEEAAKGKTVLYIEVQLDTLLDPESEPILPRQLLDAPQFERMHWDTQSSGIQIPEDIAAELERIWAHFSKGMGFNIPEEVEDGDLVYEGAVRRISVNAYERSPEARRRCVAYYGSRCYVCGLDLGKVYGPIGVGFIHVHHLRPLSKVGQKYRVDPIRDLRPVCPNCHAIIHRRTPPFTLEEVREFIREAKRLSGSDG